jgi:hypothetical protein
MAACGRLLPVGFNDATALPTFWPASYKVESSRADTARCSLVGPRIISASLLDPAFTSGLAPYSMSLDTTGNVSDNAIYIQSVAVTGGTSPYI